MPEGRTESSQLQAMIQLIAMGGLALGRKKGDKSISGNGQTLNAIDSGFTILISINYYLFI